MPPRRRCCVRWPIGCTPQRRGTSRCFQGLRSWFASLFADTSPQFDQVRAQLQLVGKIAGIERTELLCWIAAWSALSGIWHLEDGQAALASFPHAITALALDRLRAGGSSHPA